MMKKNYIQPTLEILPVSGQYSLCDGSGGGSTDIQVGTGGGKPWDDGRAPHRTAVF